MKRQFSINELESILNEIYTTTGLLKGLDDLVTRITDQCATNDLSTLNENKIYAVVYDLVNSSDAIQALLITLKDNHRDIIQKLEKQVDSYRYSKNG